MPDDVEPTNSELERVDDAAPDVEQPVPDESALSAEEYTKEMEAFKSDGERLTFRQQQIRHWLRYQYSKMHKLSAKDSGKENPFTILLHRLAGLSISKPCKPQAFALWAKANTAQVQQAWDQELKKKDIPAGGRAAKLNAFKSKLFKKESDEVQQQWVATAEEEHEDTMKEYNDKIESPVSKDPADVQQCLEHLPSVVQPFIEMLMEATGCVVTCIVAGPQPTDRGRLHVSSFHAGKTLGNIKQNFVQAERANYRKYMVPMFANFLKKCYTVEMCRARALAPNTPTLESIGFTSEEQGVALDAISGNVYNNAGDRVGFDNLPTTNTPSSGVPANGAISNRVPATPSRAPSRVPTPLPAPPLKSPSHAPAPPPACPLKSPSRAPTPPPARPLKSPSHVPTPLPAALSKPSSREPNLPPSHQLPSVLSRAPSLAPTPAPSPPQSPVLSCQAMPAPPPASKPPSLAGISSPIDDLGEGMNPTASTLRLGEGREEASRGELSEGRGARSSKKRKPRVGSECTRPKKQAKTRPDEPIRPTPKIIKGKKKGTTRGMMVAQLPDKNRPVNMDAMTETPPVLMELLAKAPKWSVDTLAMFKREKTPPQFTRLLNLWIQFESQEHFADSSKFRASQRPQAVHDWIAQGRSPMFHLQKVPKGVDPVTEFEGKFWAWWASLQPQGRLRDGALLERDEEGCPSRVFEGDWETLCLPGANGWSSVIAAICFWSWRLEEMKTDGYRVAAAAERAQKSWNHALDDVEWVLSHLV